MMRSMFSGVSSLRVHQTRMDVIANNIANVNTVGFKSQRATFSDAFYQRIQGASGPDPLTGRAGTNPQQIGLGLSLASIDNIMTQGATQRTDNAMDIMLTGTGFLIVQDAGGTFFTRAGNIGRDFQNNLHINGMQLMGWSTVLDETTGQHNVDRSALVPLSLGGDKQNMPAEPTTVINWTGNMNITQLTTFVGAAGGLPPVEGLVRSKVIFDSLGNRYTIDVRLVYHRSDQSSAPTSPHSYWTMEILQRAINPTTGELVPRTDQTDTDGWAFGIPAFLEGDRTRPALIGMCFDGARPAADSQVGPGMPPGAQPGVNVPLANRWENHMITEVTLAFNSRGELVGMGPADSDARTSIGGGDSVPSPIRFGGPGVTPHPGTGISEDVIIGNIFDNIAIVPIYGVSPAATFGRNLLASEYSPGPGTPPATPPEPPLGTVITRVGSFTFNMRELFQRGGENTTLRALTMDGNGPGTLQDISIGTDGTIMGRFSNGRTRVLGQIPLAFFQNPEGLERIGGNLWVPTANSGPFDGIGLIGEMQGGALEMSNVDLANEFTEMITTQRGFQAASRTITVSDEMLQELVNLRR